MRIKTQAKALALLRDKYQKSRGRGAVITIGHVEHGTLPEDIPAKLRMEEGYMLDESELAKLVAYLQLQARDRGAAVVGPQEGQFSRVDASCAKRAPPAVVNQAPQRAEASPVPPRDRVPAAGAAVSRAGRTLQTWYERAREAFHLWCLQAVRR